MSERQSLFQVYYLGSVEVDRRFSSSVIPWVIEQLKLDLQDMKLVWVTLGPTSIEYVADSGSEVESHCYSTVLRWSSGLDNVSFAYIIVNNDKTFCHAFQCLDLSEAEVIIQLFKSHCSSFDISSEPPFKLSSDKLSSLILQQKKKNKSRLTKGKGEGGEFNVVYSGSIKATMKSPISAQTVDGFVSCLSLKEKPTEAKKYNKWSKRKNSSISMSESNSMYRSSSVSEDTDRIRTSSDISNMSALSDDKKEEAGGAGGERGDPKPATRIEKFESSTEMEEEEEAEPEDEFDYIMVEDFDALPCVQVLQTVPEFLSLSIDDIIKVVRDNLSLMKPSVIHLSGAACQLREEGSNGSVIFSYNTKRVLGCAQGLQCQDYVGFVTRERGSTNITLHFIRCTDSKAAASVIKTFKHSFDACVSLSLPNTLCDTCPINIYNIICQELTDTPLGTVHDIHTVLERHLNDDEISRIESPHDPYENEHTQLVKWVTILRSYYQKKQATHVHGGADKGEGGKKKKTAVGKTAKKLLHLRSITGSYDNLRMTEHKQLDTLHSSSAASFVGYTSSQQSSPTRTSNNDVSAGCSRDVSPELKIKSNEVSEKRTLRMRTDSGAPGPQLRSPLDSGHVSPTGQSPFRRRHQRSMSWRQQIFESVTPNKTSNKRKASIRDVMERELKVFPQRISFTESLEDDESAVSVRAKRRWRWAIEQQLLLIKLEKANESVLQETLVRQKLNYADDAVDTNVMSSVWMKLIEETPTHDDLLASIKMGVPVKLRDKVWRLLIMHYRTSHPGQVPITSYISSINKSQFINFYKQHTEYETLITADIDRTYPNNVYFSKQVKHGRIALYNVLKAYAVSDPDIGYCQGLSFVAGLFILHSLKDVDGFNILSDFMHLYGFRDVYSSDMYQLQIKLYQFSRLVHDTLPNLHVHLEEHDITPFLYAAPWFLTIFSSQFPLHFVARVMDLVLLEGIISIFKVGLAILMHYQEDIIQLNGMESITDFIKVSVPQRVSESVSEILHTAIQVNSDNLSTKLQTFQTEYHVMHELMATFHMKESSGGATGGNDTEKMNELLKKQNKDLIEQIAVCRGAIMRLESKIQSLYTIIEEQGKRIERLENKDTDTVGDKEQGNDHTDLFYSETDEKHL